MPIMPPDVASSRCRVGRRLDLLSLTNGTAIALFLMLLGACSDTDRGASGDSADANRPAADEEQNALPTPAPGVQVATQGNAPLVQLSIAELGSATIDVSATSSSEGMVGDSPVVDRIEATYRLNVEISASDFPSQLTSRMSASDVNTTGFASGRDAGPWEWRVGSNGVPGATTRPVLARGSRLGELLSTPGLFLLVPSEPVGEGAVWSYVSPGRNAPVEVKILGISEDEVEAEITARIETPDATVETTASGRWGRGNLLAREVTSRVDVSVDSTTSRNGTEVPVELSKQVEFIYGVPR